MVDTGCESAGAATVSTAVSSGCESALEDEVLVLLEGEAEPRYSLEYAHAALFVASFDLVAAEKVEDVPAVVLPAQAVIPLKPDADPQPRRQAGVKG